MVGEIENIEETTGVPCYMSMPGIESGLQRWHARILPLRYPKPLGNVRQYKIMVMILSETVVAGILFFSIFQLVLYPLVYNTVYIRFSPSLKLKLLGIKKFKSLQNAYNYSHKCSLILKSIKN